MSNSSNAIFEMPRRKITFSNKHTIRKYTIPLGEPRGTRKGSQTLGHFKRVIAPQIRKLYEKGAYGDKPINDVLKEQKKKFIDFRSRTRRKERLLTTDKDATVAHYIAQLMEHLNKHNYSLNYTTINEIFDGIEETYTDPYICVKYKKAVLKYILGHKKDHSNTLLNAPLKGTELSTLIQRSKTCPEHHKIESAASANTSNKPSNNKPKTE